ncbi:hypothetical protein [Bombella apis]|uniref:hypothetical protein n=1 Tax=Bombella apis TaxID=1785988 RepID=UPI0023F4B304|nr:hypothetical protein [Bombella apis]MCT6845286.1 hypothetical protein [Bombella apis]
MKLLRLCLPMVACSVLGVQGALAAPSPAGKMSAAACRQAFSDAKKAGTLNGQKYADFKLDHCTGSVAAAQPQSPAASTPVASAPAETGKPAAPAAAAPVASGNVLFPARVSPEFASLSPGKARMKTCLAQYNANKSSGRNGSLKWIQKGGGYYSECNTRLKSAAQ